MQIPDILYNFVSLKTLLMRRFLLFAVAFFSLTQIIAQTVQLLDKITYSPVQNAVIVNEDRTKSVQTNKKGIAKFDIFSKDEKLEIIHTSYTNINTSVEQVKADEYKIYLMPAIMHLEELVISVSRRTETRSDIPYRISAIKTADLEIYQPQTSADLLAASREVFVQKSQMGGGSPMIRGFGSNRVLLVVDGVRMNNAIFRHGNLHNVISVDPNSVENVEVIFGPGSVIYGSDAIGGVISFNTRKPYFSDDGICVSSDFTGRFSSANMEKSMSASVEIASDEFAYLTTLSFSDFGDLTTGTANLPDTNYLRRHVIERWGDRDTIIRNMNRHLMKGTAYNYHSIVQKFRYKASENLEMSYAFHHSKTSDIPRFDRLNIYRGENLRFAEWYYGPQTWMLNNFRIKYDRTGKYFDEINIGLAHQLFEESRHNRSYKDDWIYRRFEKVNAITLNADFYKRYSSDHNFNYGLEFVHNNVISSAFRANIVSYEKENIATRYPDLSLLNSFAAYFSYKYYVNSKFILSSGLRYSHSIIDAGFDNNIYNFPFDEILSTGAPVGGFGFVYKPDNTMNISMNASSGFRAPNVDDIAKVFDSEPGTVVVPNTGLKPEYIYSADLGLNKRFGTKISIETSGFYSYLQNVMVREDFSLNGADSLMYDGVLSRVQAVVNADYAIIYGAGIGIKADLNEFVSFKSSLTWMDGFDNNDNPIRHVTPLFGSAHLILKADKLMLDLYAIFNGKISPEKLSTEEHGKDFMYARDFEYAATQMALPSKERFNPEGLYSPAWHTINFSGVYQVHPQVRLGFGVENITNVRYRTYSSGIPAFGRNYILSVRGSF